jgi:hypothetical protein
LVPFLAVNPHFRPDLEAAFGSTTRIFPVLARELLRPSTAVRLKLQPLPAHVIAMHVRTQFDSRPSQQMPLNFEATFFSCAQEIVASIRSRLGQPRFVLFTERPATLQRARGALGRHLDSSLTKLASNPAIKMRAHAGNGDTSYSRAMDAAVDFWTLVSAQRFVLSPWSTYSSVALALANHSADTDDDRTKERARFGVTAAGKCIPLPTVDPPSHAFRFVLNELHAREAHGSKVFFARCISHASMPQTKLLERLHRCYGKGCWPPWIFDMPDAAFWVPY